MRSTCIHTIALAALSALVFTTGCDLSDDLDAPAAAAPADVDAVIAGLDEAGVLECNDSIEHIFSEDAIQPPEANSGHEPVDEEVVGDALAAAMAAGHSGMWGEARARINEVGYHLCRVADIVVFHPQRAGEGLPLAAWRQGPARPFIVEVPHAWNELRTLEQGVEALLYHDARAVLVSGAHRCAGHEEVACDGRSSVCGAPGAYRVTDPAHNTESAFHAMHAALTTLFPRDYAISLHGTRHDHVVISDGTDLAAHRGIPVAEAAVALNDRITQALQANTRVETCNEMPGFELSERWCGTTNVQGRHLNDSADHCGARADISTGRFIHLEQPLAIRNNHRGMVIEALFDALD